MQLSLTTRDGLPVKISTVHIVCYNPRNSETNTETGETSFKEGTSILTTPGVIYHVREHFNDVDKAYAEALEAI